MIVMLMNKEKNKKQYFQIKKQTLNQSKSACPSILKVKHPNIYIHINKQTSSNNLTIIKLIKLKLSQNSFTIDCLTVIYGVC